MPEHLALPLDRPALHVDVAPGGEIVLRGSYESTRDGSIIDAATTTWPATAPGGGSVDAGGLVDFEAGGFHVTSRDPATHEVHAIATGKGGEACSAVGTPAPCLALRTLAQARTRLLTVQEWQSSLQGRVDAEIVAPPAYAPAADAAKSAAPYLAVAGALAVAVAAAIFVTRARRKQRLSPSWQLQELGRRVRAKLQGADAILAAPLAPAVEATLRALRDRRVDPMSKEGLRVREVLLRVEASLDDSAHQAKAEKEQEIADELVREVESALEAAEETLGYGKGARG